MTYSARTHVAPGDLGTAADNNQGMDNEEYLKSEHDLASPTDLNAGWRDSADTWVYVSAASFKITGADRTAIYQKGTRIRWKDGGAYKYAVVASSSFSTDTTVTFTGGSDYTMANATITDNYYSYEDSPQGYPDWFNWSPTVVGFSSLPTGTDYKFCVHGRLVALFWSATATGTSDSTSYTISLPITAMAITASGGWRGRQGYAQNNGSVIGGAWDVASSGTVLSLYAGEVAVAWTASGPKISLGMAAYGI